MRILQGKILVRNPKIQGRIFGSTFSAMRMKTRQKSAKKNYKSVCYIPKNTTARIYGNHRTCGLFFAGNSVWKATAVLALQEISFGRPAPVFIPVSFGCGLQFRLRWRFFAALSGMLRCLDLEAALLWLQSSIGHHRLVCLEFGTGPELGPVLSRGSMLLVTLGLQVRLGFSLLLLTLRAELHNKFCL